MPKTDEKLAAILAEMRKAVVPMICGRPKIEAVSIRDVLQWADRIEAAAEREISEAQDRAASQATLDRTAKDAMEYYAQALKQKQSAPGNAPAMREALENLVHRKCLVSGSCSKPIEEQCEHPSCVWYECRAALAAPARNCDRFKTLDEAREAFQDLRGHKILADVELWDSMDEAGALVRWLFAPAQGGAE